MWPFDLGERVVVMDALLVFCADPEPGDPRVLAQYERCVPHNVLNESRGIVCLHRHEPLILSFEQGEHGGRCRPLRHLDKFLDPDELRLISLAACPPHLDRNVASLIVRSVVTDRLAAWAEACHGDTHAEDEIVPGLVR